MIVGRDKNWLRQAVESNTEVLYLIASLFSSGDVDLDGKLVAEEQCQRLGRRLSSAHDGNLYKCLSDLHDLNGVPSAVVPRLCCVICLSTPANRDLPRAICTSLESSFPAAYFVSKQAGPVFLSRRICDGCNRAAETTRCSMGSLARSAIIADSDVWRTVDKSQKLGEGTRPSFCIGVGEYGDMLACPPRVQKLVGRGSAVGRMEPEQRVKIARSIAAGASSSDAVLLRAISAVFGVESSELASGIAVLPTAASTSSSSTSAASASTSSASSSSVSSASSGTSHTATFPTPETLAHVRDLQAGLKEYAERELAVRSMGKPSVDLISQSARMGQANRDIFGAEPSAASVQLLRPLLPDEFNRQATRRLFSRGGPGCVVADLSTGFDLHFDCRPSQEKLQLLVQREFDAIEGSEQQLHGKERGLDYIRGYKVNVSSTPVAAKAASVLKEALDRSGLSLLLEVSNGVNGSAPRGIGARAGAGDELVMPVTLHSAPYASTQCGLLKTF